MSERFADLSGFFCAAESAVFVFDHRIFAIGIGLRHPFGEVVNVRTGGSAGVADRIANVVVRMIGNVSCSTANVAVSIAYVIVSVGGSNSKFRTNVAFRIAYGTVNVVRGHSKLAANVTG